MELSEQELIRRNSLQELINLGIDPYPAEGYEVNATIHDILGQFPDPGVHYRRVPARGE